MSSVHELRPGALDDADRAEFLATVARHYDDMARDGEKPDSIVFCVAKLKGAAHASWVTVGESKDAISAVLARATYCINRVANQTADESRYR